MKRQSTGGWLDAMLVYGQPRMLSMLALGFSSGLPFMLIYSTLSAWLRQSGIERATIGMLSWVGLVYTLKFLWAPVVNRLRLPVIGRLLGQRRSWMLLAQAGIASALLALSAGDPRVQVGHMALLALLLAFAAATQDVAIDAWRIESAPGREQGAMAAAYQLGYRLAILVGSAGALWIASDLGWARCYSSMAALVGIGVIATLLVREPERIAPRTSVLSERRVIVWLAHRAHWPDWLRHAGAWVLGAVLCPVLDFFSRYGAVLGLLIFAFIGTYRLTDYTMGTMANPFYLDLGFTLKQIAAVAKIYGTALSVVGIVVGGLAVARLGRTRSLILGSALVIISNVSFSILAARGAPSLAGLATVISLDNFAQGVHGTALIAFMSSLTSASYTATQYAVLSSLYALPGKLLMGTSGIVVNHIGYPTFFLYTASLSIPALVLLYLLSRRADFAPLRKQPRGLKAAMAPTPEFDLARVLCRLSDLPAKGCREFRLGAGSWPLRGFLVRVGSEVRAYVNRCAHLHYPLNYTPNAFLTADGSMIVCSMHGALFEKLTGYCVAGPCQGKSLVGLPVRIESGLVLLADEVDPEELAARYA